MTQEHPMYKAGGGNISLDAAIFRRFKEPNYRPPTVDELRAVKDYAGLSGGEIAKLVGVDVRTWRKWTAPPDSDSYRPIPYAAWRLLLIELGIEQEKGIHAARDRVAEQKP